jgi:molybdopterin molybdotransferase
MEFFQCISLKEARSLVEKSLQQTSVGCETVDLIDAAHRIAAQDLLAKEDLPPFDRSTVDGYAVNSKDTFGAGEAAPALFTVVGEVMMGGVPAFELLPGQAAAIPTGGMLPKGADAVIMLEYTERMDDEVLLVSRAVAPGENLVIKGEDVCRQTKLIVQGQIIYSQHVGILAACGYSRVPVYKKLHAAIISTGDELVDVSETPKMGQIRDINSYSLGALLKEMGCVVRRLGIVRDNYEAFLEAVTKAMEDSQLIIISGGSSVGARDYTVKALEELGGVLFHGIAVKPGKPTIFGLAGEVPIFGLPGHPVAAMMVFRELVAGAAYLLMGNKKRQREKGMWVKLERNIPSAPGRDDFISVRLHKEAFGYTAEPILGKSGLIHTIAAADAVLHIPAEQGGLYAGDLVEVFIIGNWT